MFQPLSRAEVEQIVDLLIQAVNDRLAPQEIQIEETAAFKEQLLVEGYDPSYGARSMGRAIAYHRWGSSIICPANDAIHQTLVFRSEIFHK